MSSLGANPNGFRPLAELSGWAILRLKEWPCGVEGTKQESQVGSNWLVIIGLVFVLILIVGLPGVLPRIDRCDQQAGSIHYDGPCTF